MRTTLKRGIGRSPAVNGNGRAVYPPGTPTPMRRYRIPPPPGRTGWQTVRWFFRWVAIALVMVVVGLAGGAYLWSQETLSAVAPHSQNVKKARVLLTQKVPSPTEPAVALLIGYDARKGPQGALAGSRSDTVMLVRADPQNNTVSMLSLPRDLLVPIYCGKGPIGVVDRINSAWARCNASGTVATITALTGIRPDYLITVDFHGFKLLVNKLHGVYVDVDHRYLNTHGGPSGYATINLEPGYQRLDGQQALNFVRFRHTDSDLVRLARQQLFLTALRQRISSGSIFTVFKIIGAIKGNLEIENGAGGALSKETALSFLQFAHGLSSGHFFRVAIGDLSGYNELTAPQSAIDTAVQQFLHPDVQAATKANAAALNIKRKPHKPKLKPSEISTLVLNGTTVSGFAANTSYGLAKLGYRTVALTNGQLPNAPSQSYVDTQVYYARGKPTAKAAAKQLQKLFPGSYVGPIPSEIGSYERASGNPETIVVLGSSFDGNLRAAVAPPDTTPKHTPPQVATASSATSSAVRSVRRQIYRFPLMVPGVLANGSALAQLTPVRVYKPASGHVALRLTYVTPPGNVYWGIQETDWKSAPVLEHASLSRTFGGRHFDFFYTGSHLHMVVLRTTRASYWVVNTLRDDLSNETMIAIAKSLRPLGK